MGDSKTECCDECGGTGNTLLPSYSEDEDPLLCDACGGSGMMILHPSLHAASSTPH